MGRSFNGTSAYLEAAAAAVVALPLTMACWARPNNTTTKVLISISTSGGTDRYQLVHAGSAKQCNAQAVTGTLGDAQFGTASSGAWGHFCGVFESTTKRTAYYNGVAGTANTTSVTPAGMNRTLIGARIATTVGSFANASIADVAIWDDVLTALEIARLSQGTRPSAIRPQNLVFYNPLDDRWAYDLERGLFLAETGPTGASDDPPLILRPPRKYYLFSPPNTTASRLLQLRRRMALSA